MLNNFRDLKKSLNIDIIKCFKTFFSKDGIKNNIGSYLLIIIIFLFILAIILFYLKEEKYFFGKLNNIFKINKESNNKNNINDNNNKHKEENDLNNNKKITKYIRNQEDENLSKNNSQNSKNNLKIPSNNSSNSSNLRINISKKEKDIQGILLTKNNISDNNTINSDNIFIDSEINAFSYEEAMLNDKRTYLQYYISLVKTKHILLITFLSRNDYNSLIIKICLFLFSFSLYYFVNLLFFTDETMHKIKEDEGIFNFIYSIPQIIYSTLISSIINIIVNYFALSEKNIFEIRKCKSEIRAHKINKTIKCLKIKFSSYFIISFFFLIVFWYYIGCFCAVYRNTQIYAIKDTLISFGLSLVFPFIIYLIPGLFRLPSLKNPEWFYLISKFIQLLS